MTANMSPDAEDLAIDIFQLLDGIDPDDAEQALMACLLAVMTVSGTYARFVDDIRGCQRFRCEREIVTRESTQQ